MPLLRCKVILNPSAAVSALSVPRNRRSPAPRGLSAMASGPPAGLPSAVVPPPATPCWTQAPDLSPPAASSASPPAPPPRSPDRCASPSFRPSPGNLAV